jgi:excisionase family DNA binding protein
MDAHQTATAQLTQMCLSISEAAKALGICRTNVYREIKEGRLTAKKSGRRTLIPIEAAQAWRDALPAMAPRAAA